MVFRAAGRARRRGRRARADDARRRRRSARRCTASCAAATPARATRRSRSSRCSTMPLDGTARATRVDAVARDARSGRRARSSCSAATARTASWPRRAATMPICALSTGTNNAFPEMREATVAGLADRAGRHRPRAGDDALRARGARCGSSATAPADLALVDVAVSRERFVGARALWRADGVSELVRRPSPARARSGCRRSPALLAPLAARRGRGLHVRLGRRRRRRAVLAVPLAPGLVDAGRRGRAPRARAGRRGRARAGGAARSRSTASARSSAAGEPRDRPARRRAAARSTSTR